MHTYRVRLVWNALDSRVGILSALATKEVLGFLDKLAVPAFVFRSVLGLTFTSNIRLEWQIQYYGLNNSTALLSRCSQCDAFQYMFYKIAQFCIFSITSIKLWKPNYEHEYVKCHAVDSES